MIEPLHSTSRDSRPNDNQPPPKRRRTERSTGDVEASILKNTSEQNKHLNDISISLRTISVTLLNVESLLHDFLNKT